MKYDAIKVTKSEWDGIVAGIDRAVEVSLLSGSPDPAMAHGRDIIRQGQIRGVALAKLLYEISQNWHLFSTDDRIEDAIERDMGIPPDTFYKYSRMYQYVLEGRPQLAGLPVEGLIKLIAAAREGQLDAKDWREIAGAHNVRAIIAVRDRVRGVATSGGTRLSAWCTPSGQLYLKRGPTGERKHWGFVPRGSKDPDIEAMVARMEQIGVIFQ